MRRSRLRPVTRRTGPATPGPVARVIEPVARAADGTLWFGTDPGMAVIAPEPFGRRQARLEFSDDRWELIPTPAPR